jgi:hypothetical protein
MDTPWPRSLQEAEKKSQQFCHPEGSEGSAFSFIPGKKQIPRANTALGMTILEFPRSL